VRFGVAGGPVELQGVLLDIDPESGGCERIEAWSRPIPEGSRG
jgi:calcineurin-like phosphoesterase